MVILFKAQILLSLIASIKATTVKGNLPNLQLISSIIEKFLQPDVIEQYVRPYMQSLKFSATNNKATDPFDSNSYPIFRVTDDVSVEKAIKAKIAELKSFLQDNEADELDKDGHNENDTMIIEFIPKSKISQNKPAFELSTGRFKKLRDKIKNALEKENVTKKTKKLVIRTLDEMLANMMNNTCTYKANDPEKVLRDGEIYSKKNKESMLEWDYFKQSFASANNDDFKEVLEMFKPFYSYFSKYVNHLSTDRYVVSCKVNPKDEYNADLRKKNVKAKNPCIGFKLCTGELQGFLVDFYNSLNDTIVSVFRNYAAMYERDVTVDSSSEKELVVSQINKAGDKAEKKMKKIFKKELAQLNFDRNKSPEINVKILKEYVKQNVEHLKTHLNNHLENDLKALRAKLLLILKEDLDVNIDVDLGNLEGEFVSKICRTFISCNGAYFTRRHDEPSGKTLLRDANSVYVKLRLNLDKQLKDAVLRTNRQLLGVDELKRNIRRFGGRPFKIDLLNSSRKLHITRTTMVHNATADWTQNTAIKSTNHLEEKDFAN